VCVYAAAVLGLGIKNAGYAAKATILGASMGNMLFLLSKKHPKANRPMVDYEVAR
jgi:hypothetical protein